ncbi:hypothetical protein MAIC_00630 [Mycolicibacterium aichiense]|uniref:Uncharacterized protein n=1 Tax=Mycolicibacterium aichiense TaxID=1799 RepID=A0AAD1HH11_9MYCO|nr:hypothetical protein MAIC_00630 [Mycolicibacterium aichiense]
MLIPMKVPPKSAAPISAAATPPKTPATAIPPACAHNAVASSAGWDHRELNAAHSAAEGMVARPTTSHVAPPSQCGASWATAATRNVPAMM